MQGRLSPKIGGKIQAFPMKNWKSEFSKAKEIGFYSIEWIFENPIEENPLYTTNGRQEIANLIQETGVQVEYVCADFFMQNPIVNEKQNLKFSETLILKLLNFCKEIGAKCIEIPFVDQSSLLNRDYSFLINFFNSFENELKSLDLLLNLETDLNANPFKNLISELNLKIGANYDIGNSASLGYNFFEEIEAYGKRINNVHIKDRVLGGSTIEFGKGNAKISNVLQCLSDINYENGITLQGYRGDKDIEIAIKQFHFTKQIISDLNSA